MRKLMLLIVVGLLALPVMAGAQQVRCETCSIGLFDDPALNKNFGDMAGGTPKDIYVGVILDAGTETGVTGLEFSVSGIRQAEDGILVLSVDALTADPLTISLGTAPAPADTTSTSSGTGGLNLAWATCQSGGALVKMSLLTFTGVGTNKVFKVLRKYPPSNPEYAVPLFTRCDGPLFTKVGVPGGCYIANWDGVTDPVELCQTHVAVEKSTWSGMKQLFR
jgi:hypothetical protein